MATLASQLILSLVDKVTGPSRGIGASLSRIDRQVDQLSRSHRAAMAPITGFAGRLLALGGAYIGVREGFNATAGAAMSFESAMADVRKVTDATDGQFANMRQQIIDLSRQMPITAEGFAQIYAAAGQSGIAQGELRGFAEAVAKVSTAWDVPVAETGEALAKIKTALNRTVPETVRLADALNHVSNIGAASAPDLLEYTNRVAAFAETAGFSAEQALAFGGAMVGSGFEPEVAATSFRNMSKALAAGTQATKRQRVAMKVLGIDAVKTAKNMQKDAVGTTLDVFDRLKKLPAEQRISMASALFGDEARGLAPLLKDATELRRLLTETGNASRYAGSAFKEYVVRANTVGNVLDILKNKVADVFRSKGDEILPGIKEAALGLGYILDSLGERAGVFDQIGASMRGFVQGLGFKGGIREAVEGLGDVLFGKVDGAGAADKLGALFAKFEGWGQSVRSFYDAVSDSPIAGFLGEISGYGVSLALGAAGIGIFASAVSTLASAMWTLSGARAAVGILATLAKGGRWTASALGLLGTAGATLPVPTAGRAPVPAPVPAAPAAGGSVVPEAAAAAGGLGLGAIVAGILAGGTAAAFFSKKMLGELDEGRRKSLYTNPLQGAMAPDLALGAVIADAPEDRAPSRDPWGEIVNGIVGSFRWRRDLTEGLPGEDRRAMADALIERPGLLPLPVNRRTTAEIPGKRADDREGRVVYRPWEGLTPPEPALPKAVQKVEIVGGLFDPIGAYRDWQAPAYEPDRTKGGVSDVRPMPAGTPEKITPQIDMLPAKLDVGRAVTEMQSSMQIRGAATMDSSSLDQAIGKARTLLDLLQQAGTAARIAASSNHMGSAVKATVESSTADLM